MKKLLFITLLGFLSFSFKGASDKDEIVNALKGGNVESLSAYFDSFIDLKLPEKDELKNMGKNQATFALKNFFSEVNVTGYEVMSQREMSGTMYMVGKLQTKGKSYNITMMIKSKADKLVILTIRIS